MAKRYDRVVCQGTTIKLRQGLPYLKIQTYAKFGYSDDTFLKTIQFVSHFAGSCIENSGRLTRHPLPTLNLPGNCFFHPKNDDSYITPEKVRGL